jgi:hypothetical protein
LSGLFTSPFRCFSILLNVYELIDGLFLAFINSEKRSDLGDFLGAIKEGLKSGTSSYASSSLRLSRVRESTSPHLFCCFRCSGIPGRLCENFFTFSYKM